MDLHPAMHRKFSPTAHFHTPNIRIGTKYCQICPPFYHQAEPVKHNQSRHKTHFANIHTICVANSPNISGYQILEVALLNFLKAHFLNYLLPFPRFCEFPQINIHDTLVNNFHRDEKSMLMLSAL